METLRGAVYFRQPHNAPRQLFFQLTDDRRTTEPIRIESRLGAGGMGVVHRAYDERLQRTVGIKLLGEVTQTTPEERARLLQEARAASHLAHPHICTIYEVADTGTHAFIVMEFVDGRPLSEVIPHDGMPFRSIGPLRN